MKGFVLGQRCTWKCYVSKDRVRTDPKQRIEDSGLQNCQIAGPVDDGQICGELRAKLRHGVSEHFSGVEALEVGLRCFDRREF